MSEHTPGSWEWQFNGVGGQWILIRRTTGFGTEFVKTGGPPDVELSADQRLIAAAPDLLEALESMLEGRPTKEPPRDAVRAHHNWTLFENARHAIAKAKG